MQPLVTIRYFTASGAIESQRCSLDPRDFVRFVERFEETVGLIDMITDSTGHCLYRSAATAADV